MANHQRHQHILDGRELRQQMIELKDHSKLFITQPIARPGGQLVDSMIPKVNLAGIRLIESAEQMEQRTFTRTALTDDGQELAGAQVEINSA